MTAFRVVNMRKGPFAGGKVLAFFSVAFGQEIDGEFVGQFVVKDFALKPKNDGGKWFQGPSKQRIKNGEAVVGEDGYNIYDEFFDLYLEKQGEKYAPTEAAWNFKKALTEAVNQAYDAAAGANDGRGAAPKKAPAKPKGAKATPAAATASKIQEDVPEPLEDDGDDSLPF